VQPTDAPFRNFLIISLNTTSAAKNKYIAVSYIF